MSVSLKPSCFNMHGVSHDGSKVFLYNTNSGAMLEAPIDMWPKIERIFDGLAEKPKSLTDKVMHDYMNRILFPNGFMVSQDHDEMLALEAAHYSRKYATQGTRVAFTVAPTLACNLGCKYCYAPKGVGAMSPEIQDAFVVFVESRLKQFDTQSAGLCWIGGEPTLCFDMMCRLSHRLKQVCRDYIASIITNGTLIDDDMAKAMVEECNIRSVQVTIDGSHHDERRPWIDKTNKESCWERVTRGYLSAAKFIMHTSLRINVDKSNCDIEELTGSVEELVKRGIPRNAIGLGWVHKNLGENAYDKPMLTTREFASLNFELMKRGVLPFPALQFKAGGCKSVAPTAFCIDPEGYISKCWNHMGYKDKRVGHILSGLYKHASHEIEDCTPFRVESCKTCKFLPVCMGGCPYWAASNNMICVLQKYLADAWLPTYAEHISSMIDAQAAFC